MNTLQFVDITDSVFNINIQKSPDICEFWDYDLELKYNNEKYLYNLSKSEVNQLRENCKRILQATEIHGGN